MSLGTELSPAWGGFLRTHARLVQQMTDDLEHAHGMTLNTYDVLRQLAVAPGERLRMSTLADRVMLTRPGLTGVVNRLQEAGLVSRSRVAADGRGLVAQLTPLGRRRLRAAHATHVASIRRLFGDRLDRDDLRALRRAWEKLAADQHAPSRPGVTALKPPR